ncbi:unnamed protein product [Triticum turgidum subsp. durum]|uniref:Uncharacterized protein n=1 Tax=Triticum turgidum subsp. durum TaxID=4567 RepID=A0A9R1PZF6_TRITD|nr:unnamed protein product [Triticum turgidum subsp. durum]
MKGSSSTKLSIGYFHEDRGDDFDESSNELRMLDDKILMFHNLRNLKSMVICGCRNLSYISFKGFSYLVSLTSLEIRGCEKLLSSNEMPEHAHEDMPTANCSGFPSLKSLRIVSCGIAGKWLSLMLQHAPCLEKLYLYSGDEENSVSNLSSTREGTSSGNPNGGLARDGPSHIPLNLFSPLKKITIERCPRLTFDWGKEGVSGFTSLEKLLILDRPDLLSSLVHTNGRWLLPASLQKLTISDYSQEALQPCFPSDITSLKRLRVYRSPDLQSLQLHSCTAREELSIWSCGSLTVTALEGLQPLGSHRHLDVSDCIGLPPFSESLSRLCPRLEMLEMNGPSVLTTSFCKHLTSLKRLQLYSLEKLTRLTDEQERALVLLKSLERLTFFWCKELVDLPSRLRNLSSLKSLEIHFCKEISRLPEAGLPHSLEELEIRFCSKKLEDECRRLATCEGKLKVKIDWRRVN